MRLRLCEHRTKRSVPLSQSELVALRSMVPSVTIQPAEEPGHFDLTPGSIVGTARIGDLHVELRPKVGVGRLLYLAGHDVDPRMWRPESVELQREQGLSDVIAHLLCTHIERALARGMLKGYQHREDALMTVRGRVRFADQVSRRHGRLLPVECAYDEFTEDIELNRQLRAALERISTLPLRSDEVIDRLRRLRSRFVDVARVRYRPDRIPTVRFHRLNDHFRHAGSLAGLVLQNVTPEHGHGTARSQAFLFDMNAVFENFVTVALREALGADEDSFPQNARSRRLRLDRKERIRLKPDLSWWRDGTCRFVGDVKYKRVEAAGIEHGDLYQLLAYTVATELRSGMLIYAAGEAEDVAHDIDLAGKQLLVRTLPIDGSIDELARSVGQLATEVRELARPLSLPLKLKESAA